jgi:hypothetical protein
LTALLDPAVLFFIVGLFAGLVRSNLEIPSAISRFLALYLLMALGLKGGLSLAETGLTYEVGMSLLLAIVLAGLVPVVGFFILRPLTTPFNAIAVAATYGSVSAVTFITANQFLDINGVPHGGHMAAAMALMESPAIILAVVLANLVRKGRLGGPKGQATTPHPGGVMSVLHESFTDGAQLLLLASMVIGFYMGPEGAAAMKPFSADLFKGMLAFFLLDMGLMAARNLGALRGQSVLLLGYAVAAPLVHAAMALLLCKAAGLGLGDATLLAVLAASASYIAVPAVLREAIPEAQASVYVGLSLGITFPLNILFGIPLYLTAGRWLLD